MTHYEESCAGCRLSQGRGCSVGGIVKLDGNWVLNHYGGLEGYLGWMALQPRFHRMSLVDLNDQELRALGPNVKLVQQLLDDYWSETFPKDKIVRLYMTYFFESVFNTPKASPYHLHIHLIPRLELLEPVLREYSDGLVNDEDEYEMVSTINAWRTPTITTQRAFPNEYRKNDKSYKKLMEWLKNRIESSG